MASKKDKGKGKIDSKALVLKPESTPHVESFTLFKDHFKTDAYGSKFSPFSILSKNIRFLGF
jgi:hypothetical protein